MQLRAYEILGSPLLTALVWAGLAGGLGLSLVVAGALYLRIPEVEGLALQIWRRLARP
jgi:putative peptidoglycan lipid II flippase